MALPPLLAGPILRRCEPDRVLAWLATSTPFRFGMEVREVVPSRGGASLGGASLSPRTESLSVQLGQNLYVHIVGAFPTDGVSLGRRMTEREAGRSAGFPTDTLLAYDIYDQDSPRRLADLIDLAAVSLRPLRWPTFVLASRQSGYRSLYASCRKLHGDGDDAMLAAERVLARDAADPGRRIAALLLGGDQIYADDVSDLITPTVSELATAVTGREEQLPGVSTPPARMRPWDRGAAAAAAGFTSTAAANHLLTFGDFAAMYLLAWNPDLWPRAGRWPSPFEQYQGIDPARRPRPMAEYLLRLRDEVPKLEAARRGTAAARRVLANVPTYMIFDDHEITDDWYLNGKWKRDVLGNPTGRRAIANGLAAYWAFQGWGNEPGQFDLNRFVAPIVTHLASGTDAHAGGYENTVIDFHDWGFVAPTRPGTVFLNTRTRRDPNGASFDVRFQEVRLPPAGVPAGVAPIPIPARGTRADSSARTSVWSRAGGSRPPAAATNP